MKTKVYISGKVTGTTDFNLKFKLAEKYLKSEGYKAVNPVAKFGKERKTWDWYMKKDLSLLLKCDAIYLLPDWSYSKGAQIELNLAQNLGMKVITGTWEQLKWD